MLFSSFTFLIALAAGPAESPQPSAAADSAAQTTAPFYRVSIGRVTIVDTATIDTLSIVMRSGQHEFAAYDLKLAADGDQLSILAVLPGSFQDSCGWEFFSARSVPQVPGEGTPSSVWQVIGIAETIPDDTAPRCFVLEGPAEIARVVVAIGAEREGKRKASPIFFYWEDCTDNTVSSRSGDTLAVSSSVITYVERDTPNFGQIFPNRTGTPRQCFVPGRANTPLRIVEFQNGGIEFEPVRPALQEQETGTTPPK